MAPNQAIYRENEGAFVGVAISSNVLKNMLKALGIRFSRVFP